MQFSFSINFIFLPFYNFFPAKVKGNAIASGEYEASSFVYFARWNFIVFIFLLFSIVFLHIKTSSLSFFLFSSPLLLFLCNCFFVLCLSASTIRWQTQQNLNCFLKCQNFIIFIFKIFFSIAIVFCVVSFFFSILVHH